MIKTHEQEMAESATGLYQTGDLIYFDNDGNKLTKEQAIELLNSEDDVFVPAAGAGSYRAFFTDMGFEDVAPIITQASAGDWTFGIKNDNGWFVGQQENNYPAMGFRYVISPMIDCCQTFEELVEKVETY